MTIRRFVRSFTMFFPLFPFFCFVVFIFPHGLMLYVCTKMSLVWVGFLVARQFWGGHISLVLHCTVFLEKAFCGETKRWLNKTSFFFITVIFVV